jgi:hypothetical protein
MAVVRLLREDLQGLYYKFAASVHTRTPRTLAEQLN